MELAVAQRYLVIVLVFSSGTLSAPIPPPPPTTASASAPNVTEANYGNGSIEKSTWHCSKIKVLGGKSITSSPRRNILLVDVSTLLVDIYVLRTLEGHSEQQLMQQPRQLSRDEMFVQVGNETYRIFVDEEGVYVTHLMTANATTEHSNLPR